MEDAEGSVPTGTLEKFEMETFDQLVMIKATELANEKLHDYYQTMTPIALRILIDNATCVCGREAQRTKGTRDCLLRGHCRQCSTLQ